MSFQRKSDLDTRQLLLFESEYRKRSKSVAAAFLLLFIGFFGLHRFFLGHKTVAMMQFSLWIILVILYIVLAVSEAIIIILLMLAVLLAIFVWFIYDLFSLQRHVNEFNKKIEEELLAHFNTGKPDQPSVD